MNFRPVETQHLPECVSLFVHVFNSPPWNEDWRSEAVSQRLEDCYHTPGFYGLIAEAGVGSIGFVLGYMEQWGKSTHFYLKEMCIASEQQRRGIGAALMNALEADLKAKGIEKIYLLTARDSSAQAFYTSCGFYVSSKMILMSKFLNPK